MPESFGLLKGLAVTNDWGKDIDRLYQREQYKANINAEQERKAKYYADLLKSTTIPNDPRATKEIEDYVNGSVLPELSNFVSKNLNWSRDIEGQRKFNEITSKILNNEPLRKGIQVQEEYKKLKDNATKLTQQEWITENEKYQAYLRGEADPYVFTSFVDVNINDLAANIGTKLGKEVIPGSQTINPLTKEVTYKYGVPDEKLLMAANTSMQDEKTSMFIDKAYNDYIKTSGIDEKYFGPTGKRDFWKDMIKTYTDLQQINGDMSYEAKLGLSNSENRVPPSAFALDKARQLSAMAFNKNAEGNYDETRSPAEIQDTNLTVFGRNKSINLNPDIGLLGFVTDASGNRNISSSIMNTQFLQGGVQFFKEGVQQWITYGGRPYLEVSGFIINPETDTDKYTFDEGDLTKAGFKASGRVDPGLFSGMQKDSKFKPGMKYTGSILVPLSISPDALTNWDDERDQKSTAYASALYHSSAAINEINEIQSLPQLKDYVLTKFSANLHNQLSPEEVQSKLGLKYEPNRYYYLSKGGVDYVFDRKTGTKAQI